jgi:hypothetical protein
MWMLIITIIKFTVINKNYILLLMSNIFGTPFINILFNYINYFEKYRSSTKIRVIKVNEFALRKYITTNH